ncbi:hypothetical protein SPRG_02887 [Saprolegnia parasitica CBS 223.65]|uniref:CASTOR ACT domain-containing protein n=1 Tax=Saprolegnia parasitica (strain CBS 223.65) TaxID=695850 RepID=A0A067CT29_SAPPC|nr:hypothetical protein SPRG_02887 [Saprolegnia parasitica CBS 223.65]KDO32410.1 hypothetical protein SPRG_02887 [Saprolegnia parasitica CBS 223.65]|eukprot:XP_012196864.1 hypothetical protein SPRG_02887 [Saprolegnia parasitica CBS 223.65]
MDLVSTSNFHATLLPGALSVLLIPPERIHACSWALLTLLLYGGCSVVCREGDANVSASHICRSKEAEVFSMVADKDGITLFMDPNGVKVFEFAKVLDDIHLAPQQWRAIQIHLGPMVAEFPGVIRFLSQLLAEDKISILNMSTYDTDIIYVQECNLEKAIHCLQSKLSRGVHGLKEVKDEENSRRLSSEGSESPSHDSSPSSPLALSPVSVAPASSSQYLAVYPASMVLVRLKKDAIRDSAFGLTQLLLTTNAAGVATTARQHASAFWCYCETAEEICLILDEDCLSDFSESAVIVSPDRWRVITLCGRKYGFEETGIVAAMSGLDSVHTQVLNISSFGSNVTLVLEDALDEAVASLAASLRLDRVERL